MEAAITKMLMNRYASISHGPIAEQFARQETVPVSLMRQLSIDVRRQLSTNVDLRHSETQRISEVKPLYEQMETDGAFGDEKDLEIKFDDLKQRLDEKGLKKLD